MPELIQYLDEIARRKKRDVLMVSFHELQDLMSLDREVYAPRIEFIDFLNKHKIKWEKCAPPRSGSGWIIGYFGDIYLNIPFDQEDPGYQLVQKRLEFKNGSPRDKRILWYLHPLSEAIRIGHRPDLDIFD